MKQSLIFMGLFISLVSYAQKKNKTAVKYAATITASDLGAHLYTIAGDKMEGRETATPGQKMAAAYIEDHFKSYGLLPGYNGSYQMHFPVFIDDNVESMLEIGGNELKLNEDFTASSGNYNASQYFSEIVFAGHGIVDSAFDDYENVDVSGKLIMILDGSPSSYKPTRSGFHSPAGTLAKLNNASKKGAAAVLVVTRILPRSRYSAKPQMYRALYKEVQLPNTFYVTESVAESIIGTDKWSEIKTVSQRMQIKPQAFEKDIHLEFSKDVKKLESSNVLGVIEGTDKKDEWVAVTAHYDHIGIGRPINDDSINNGADDDGSGTVSILELAQAFARAKADGKGPRRSMLFMTVSGEEKGLWGSEYYTTHPVYPLEKTSVDLNIDMIGRIGNDYLKDKDSVNYVYVIGDDKLSSDLEPITNKVNNTYTKLKLDRKYNDPKDPNRFYFRSDHYNFAEKGVPIIFYFNGVHADYHRPSDSPDKINYPLMAQRAQLVFYTAWEIANRDDMLKRDIPLNNNGAF